MWCVLIVISKPRLRGHDPESGRSAIGEKKSLAQLNSFGLQKLLKFLTRVFWKTQLLSFLHPVTFYVLQDN